MDDIVSACCGDGKSVDAPERHPSTGTIHDDQRAVTAKNLGSMPAGHFEPQIIRKPLKVKKTGTLPFIRAAWRRLAGIG
jgi:hypothetical protein